MEKVVYKTNNLNRGDSNEINEPYGFIYITTNLINGKRYIGQKKFDSGSRWKSYLGSGYHLRKSINKYGKDNFKRDIVDIGYYEDELNKKEFEWINNYDAVKSDDYYNMVDGGNTANSLTRRNSIRVICIDNGMIFDSISDASLWAGCSTTMIRNSFNKTHSTENDKKIKKNRRCENRYFIFRPYKKLYSGERFCCICGEVFKKEHNAQKKCNVCRGIEKVTNNNKKKKYKINEELKTKRKKEKDNKLEEMKKLIVDLYINKQKSLSEIANIIGLKGISTSMIREKLAKWSIKPRINHYSNENILYIAAYDNKNNLKRVFNYKSEAVNWINANGISLTGNFKSRQLNTYLKNGKMLNGHTFKVIDEEVYKNTKWK